MGRRSRWTGALPLGACPKPCRLGPGLWAAWAVPFWIMASPVLPAPGLAQLSPLCERNGRPDYCAYTAEDDGSDGQREMAWIVFADHTRVRLVRDELNCRAEGEFRVCDAWMSIPRTASQLLPASYRGRCIPGGYRHEYRSRVLQFAYVFLVRLAA